MKLIFIRHGDPDYSIDSLTEKGWREAEALSHRVATWNDDITNIYSSPLGRARDTASLSLNALGRTAEVHDWLREFYYPIIDPRTGKPKIAWDFPASFWTAQEGAYDRDKWLDMPFMKTGAIKENFDRVAAGIDTILEQYGYTRDGNYYRINPDIAKDKLYIREEFKKNPEKKEDTLVFFCHLGVTFVVLGYLLGLSPFQLWHIAFVAPTSVTIIGTEQMEPGIAEFRLQCLGDTKHLAAAGEPISCSGYFTPCFQK